MPEGVYAEWRWFCYECVAHGPNHDGEGYPSRARADLGYKQHLLDWHKPGDPS